MRPNRKAIVTASAALAGALLTLLAMSPLFIPMSQVTAGAIIGLVGVLCLLGIVFGVWNARHVETRRKTREDIWLKH